MFSKPSSVQPYPHHYSGDPAFDTDSDEWDHGAWCESGDAKFLPRKPGGPEPTTFIVRPLAQRDLFWLHGRSEEGSAMALYWAVSIAVQDVKGIMLDGEPHSVSRVKDGSITHLSDYDMDILSAVDNGSLVAELGARILKEVAADPS